MLRLDATTKIFQLTATATADVDVSGLSVTSAAATGFNEATAATASTQTISAAPASSTVKQIDYLSIKNTGAGANTVTVKKFNSSGAVTTQLAKATLAVDETLIYTHAGGWQTLDATGSRKVGTAGWVIAAGKIGTLSNSLTLAGTDGTTMTFPTTSASIARTDAAQTFTGTQAFGIITATTINAFAMGGAISNPSNYAANFAGGTVTGGDATFSGAVTVANNTGLYVKDSGTVNRQIANINATNVVQLGDIGNFGAPLNIYSYGNTQTLINGSVITAVSPTGLAITGMLSATTTFTSDSAVFGSPTGGNKGAGSINAVTIWKNGTALDIVFEPDYQMATIDEMTAFYTANKHLPTIPTKEVWESGSTNMGSLTDRLWETVEVQARYISQLNERIKELEAKNADLEARLESVEAYMAAHP